MDTVYRLATLLGHGALRGLGIDVRWSGAEHLPTSGPVVLAANHVSFPDFVLVERVALTRGRRVRFLTRHDVWDAPGVGWAMDRMRHVPVDRAAPAHAYLRARRLLREGEAVGGFPEAGVSWSWTVRPLMRGLLALARETGAPLVPVGIWGSQRIFSVGEPRLDLTRGRRVNLALGEPVHLAPGEDLTAATHALGHRLTALVESLQQLPHHRPRPGEVATWYPAHLGGAGPSRREAIALDEVPVNAVLPSWGPDVAAYDGVRRSAPDATGSTS